MADELEEREEVEQDSELQGSVLLSWPVDEYAAHDRGPVWYGAAITLGFGMLIYAVLTQNFLFAVIVIMFAVLIGLTALRRPEKVAFIVTDAGVAVGGRFYSYKEIKGFWMIYEPPEVKTLYIDFRRSVLPHLIIPIDDQNPLEIREALRRFLRENVTKEDEPFMDWLGRLFKI